ncbi:MAG: prepilin-type N-terminal cleavage/methylation domain-containing protein [Firmicutes bacterium]|nr:prepilin-type N-terminal cleavage/methylation domain-containing protein [Bacillota bacterium]
MLAEMQNQQGFTLVELTVGILLISAALMAVITVQQLVVRSFKIGEEKAAIQRELRTAAETIVTQIRFASEIEVLDDLIDEPDNSWQVIKIESDNKDYAKVVYRRAEDTSYIELTGFIISDVSFQVKDNLFSYKLVGKDGYELESQVVLRNLREGSYQDKEGAAVIFK